ncbi:terminase, partial [bacterium]|nr:terminase [bacterium]
MYECQKEKVKVIHENRKVILMEGRQQGKTTTSAAYILWYTLFQESKQVAILANKATAAREVLYRYQLMYENLPLWLQQGVTTWNKGDIELENNSKVFTAATSASGIRGKSVNMLYVDEAAIIPNNVAEDFFTSVYPTISAGETTKILLSSTPLGYNHFWKFWNDAENGRNDFVPLFIPYTKIPGRDEKWAEQQRRQLGELKYNQEVLCTFLGSALTLVRSDVIG